MRIIMLVQNFYALFAQSVENKALNREIAYVFPSEYFYPEITDQISIKLCIRDLH
jgi:hypothetical protein